MILKVNLFVLFFPLFSSEQAQAVDWDFVSRGHNREQRHSHFGPTTCRPG